MKKKESTVSCISILSLLLSLLRTNGGFISVNGVDGVLLVPSFPIFFSPVSVPSFFSTLWTSGKDISLFRLISISFAKKKKKLTAHDKLLKLVVTLTRWERSRPSLIWNTRNQGIHFGLSYGKERFFCFIWFLFPFATKFDGMWQVAEAGHYLNKMGKKGVLRPFLNTRKQGIGMSEWCVICWRSKGKRILGTSLFKLQTRQRTEKRQFFGALNYGFYGRVALQGGTTYKFIKNDGCR